MVVGRGCDALRLIFICSLILMPKRLEIVLLHVAQVAHRYFAVTSLLAIIKAFMP
jgi:hypothetical protein